MIHYTPYIYIFFHSQTDSFVVSQFFSVARHAGIETCQTLHYTDNLTAQPFRRPSSACEYNASCIQLSIFNILRNRKPECSIRYMSCYITRVTVVNSFARVLNPRKESANIVIHRQTVSLYHNSSVWLDNRDGSNWNRNPPIYIFIYIYIYIYVCVCVWVCVCGVCVYFI